MCTFCVVPLIKFYGLDVLNYWFQGRMDDNLIVSWSASDFFSIWKIGWSLFCFCLGFPQGLSQKCNTALPLDLCQIEGKEIIENVRRLTKFETETFFSAIMRSSFDLMILPIIQQKLNLIKYIFFNFNPIIN